MAIKKKKTAKKRKAAVELTLWDVILSYPDLHDPKPYKGKIYYRTDVLMDEDHPQLSQLRKAIAKVKTDTWGEDKTEWPKAKNPLIGDGNAREDQKGYKDRRYITPSTQTPVPVIDLKGKTFNAQLVKGGMFANVAVRVSAWEFDGDEGVSIYLQGVQIDTSKAGLNFGGGKSVKQMFKLDNDDEAEEIEEEDDKPRKAKKKTGKFDSSNDADDKPAKSKKKTSRKDEEE